MVCFMKERYGIKSLILWSVCMVPRGKTIPNANILSDRTCYFC